MKKMIISLGLILFSVMGFAANSFPPLCRISGLQFSRDDLMLFSQHTTKPRLYAIHNISHYPLWITHNVKNPSASAGWASQLSPNNWSALLVTRKKFNVICQVQTKSGIKNIDCGKVIRVCQYSHVYSKHPLDAGYWAVENVPLKSLASKIRARGL